MTKKQNFSIYIIYIVIFLSFVIPAICIWRVFSQNRIESYIVQSDSKLLDDFGLQNIKKTRGNDNRHLTFPSFHLHADRQGFLKIGDFVMQWGSGYGSEGDKDAYDLPMDLGISGINMTTIGLPFSSGGGNDNIKLRPGSTGTIVNVGPGRCERYYAFLALGFSPFEKYETKITYLDNERINKRMELMSSKKKISSEWKGKGDCGSGGPCVIM